MRTAFEISKLAFLLVVMSLAALYFAGAQLVGHPREQQLIASLLPAFFLLGGVMIGWIITVFFAQDIEPPKHLLVKGFFIGIAIGVVAVVLYFIRLGGNG